MYAFLTQSLPQIISFFANVIEIIVGGAAIIIAISQRDKISAAFTILFSYSLRASVSDLRHQLEKLKECKIEDGDVSKECRTALAHIAGKMNGNETLLQQLGSKILKRVKGIIQDLDENKPVTEATKIEIYSEIKERLESLEVNQTAKITSIKD